MPDGRRDRQIDPAFNMRRWSPNARVLQVLPSLRDACLPATIPVKVHAVTAILGTWRPQSADVDVAVRSGGGAVAAEGVGNAELLPVPSRVA